jgi:hypothetical protein
VNTENTFTELNTFSKGIRIPFDTGAPPDATCNEAREEGSIAVRSPGTAPHQFFVCDRDSTSSWSWKKLWLAVPLAKRPENCSTGDLIIITDAPPGQNIHVCVTTNQWMPQGGAASSSGGALPEGGAANDVLIQPGAWKTISGGADLCISIDWSVTPATINFTRTCLENQFFNWTGLHRYDVGYLDIKTGPQPKPPAAGYVRLWVDTTGWLRWMNAEGAEVGR